MMKNFVKTFPLNRLIILFPSYLNTNISFFDYSTIWHVVTQKRFRLRPLNSHCKIYIFFIIIIRQLLMVKFSHVYD